MRVTAYLLTFLAYALMHSLRTGYSFSKSYFKVEYNFSNTFLAVLDSSIYLAMGVGFFLRYFFLNNKDIIYSFFLTGMIFISSFSLFPILSLAGVLN
jgi:sugar phosphate permease